VDKTERQFDATMCQGKGGAAGSVSGVAAAVFVNVGEFNVLVKKEVRAGEGIDNGAGKNLGPAGMHCRHRRSFIKS